MSTYSTPSKPAPAAQEISPDSIAAPSEAKPKVTFATDDTILSQIVDLLETPSGDDALQALKDLFDALGITDWVSLGVFEANDVMSFIQQTDSSTTINKHLLKPIILKRLGWIVTFARRGTLRPGISMREIMEEIATFSQQSDLSTKKTASSSSVVDKKNIPKLDAFSGLDEDWHSWEVKTTDSLGRAGLARYLTDLSLGLANPEVAEGVFYALKQATNGGHAANFANEMHVQGKREPATLWSGLAIYYDTAVNRANVTLFEIRRLLKLRLDPDTVPTKFISDFRECMLRLTQSKATLVQDTDTLRALLLVAIQHDDYDAVRDDILKSPSKDLNVFLNAIRERDSSLQMKDAGRDIPVDGVNQRWVRRTESKGSSHQRPRWCIPFFPRSWKNQMDPGFFRLLLKWRDEAHKQVGQYKLNDAFEIKTDTYQKKVRSGKRSKVRRSKETTERSGDDGNDDKSAEVDETITKPFKRIRLAHTGSVLFERPTGSQVE